MPVEALELFEEKTGCSILEGYGLAEASPISHCNPSGGAQAEAWAPCPGADCRLWTWTPGNRSFLPGRRAS